MLQVLCPHITCTQHQQRCKTIPEVVYIYVLYALIKYNSFMKWIWLLPCFIFISCNSKSPKQVPLNNSGDTDSLKIKLIGYWGGLESDTPVWEITLDSIYYFGENKNYHYQLTDRNMVINRNNPKLVFSNISIIADTFIFYPHGQYSETRAFRIKRTGLRNL